MGIFLWLRRIVGFALMAIGYTVLIVMICNPSSLASSGDGILSFLFTWFLFIAMIDVVLLLGAVIFGFYAYFPSGEGCGAWIIYILFLPISLFLVLVRSLLDSLSGGGRLR